MTDVEIEVKLNDHDNEIGSLKRRMAKAESTIEDIRELTTSVKLMAQKQEESSKKLDKLTDKVEALDSAPKEKWNKLTTTILTAAISAVVGALITAIITLL